MRPRIAFFAAGILAAGCSASAGLSGGHLLPPNNSENSEFGKTTLVVTSTADSGPGSLRQAITMAKSGSTITFHLRKRAKIVLTRGPIVITKNVTVSGPGATALSISANGKSQIFTIHALKTVAISGLTFTKGNAAGGAGAFLAALRTSFNPHPRTHNGRAPKHPAAPRLAASAVAAVGGAIYNEGRLTVSSCTFSHNTAGGKTPGSYGMGGAIAQGAGSMKVLQSTFIANAAGGSGVSGGIGGAIYVTAGSLTLTGDTFTSNAAGGSDFGYGGAVYDDQPFRGSSNTFTKNAAYGKGTGGNAYGGGAYAGGGLSLSGGTFSENTATGGASTVLGYAFGGAIDSESSASLSSLTFDANAAAGGEAGSAEGGAIYLGGGTSKWTSLNFSANTAAATGLNSYANGGAVTAFAPLTISSGTSFVSNVASASSTGAIGGQGGAIAVEIGPLSFTGSASKNSATTEGGALWIGDTATITNSLLSNNVVIAAQNANDGGGGIYVGFGGALTLAGSTLTANATGGSTPYAGGGGIFNLGSGTITNSTINGNRSSVDGGGIENGAAGGFALINVTVDQNTASSNGGSLKNLYDDASMTITNSILARGIAGGVPSDLSNDGTVISGDYNVIETAATGTALSGQTSHNLTVDPLLAPLANNGGPTPTEADGSTSPGTAYIPYNNCLAVNVFVDQRGYPRDAKVNGYCDVGAYEDQSP